MNIFENIVYSCDGEAEFLQPILQTLKKQLSCLKILWELILR